MLIAGIAIGTSVTLFEIADVRGRWQGHHIPGSFFTLLYHVEHVVNSLPNASKGGLLEKTLTRIP
jgi:hypothetical protein